MMMEPICFNAVLPQIQGAIKLDGAGGARIQLEISEEDIVEVYKLNTLKGQVFRVTIYPPLDNGKTMSEVWEEPSEDTL